jgi:polar amino acid transport system substrate-binding protein
MLNMPTKILLVFAIALGCLVSPVQGVDIELAKDSTLEGILQRGKLRIGIEAGYMPFEMIDKRSGLRQRELRHGDVRRKGRQVPFIGFDIDMGIEMAGVLGVKPIFVDTRWPSIIPALNLGRFDIIFGGMSVTEKRKQQVDFANPLMTVGQTILLNKQHQALVKSYRDLNDPKYTVISKPATTGETAVRNMIPDCTYQPFDTEMEGAMQVLKGKADAFVYDLPFNAVFMAIHQTDKLVFLDKPFTTEPIAWAIRKNDPDFLKFLNSFLDETKKDGRFDRMYNKWFKSTDWFKHVR